MESLPFLPSSPSLFFCTIILLRIDLLQALNHSNPNHSISTLLLSKSDYDSRKKYIG